EPPLDVLGENVKLFGQIFYRQSFRQRDLSVFTHRFGLWLRAHKRRIQLLFSLTLITLSPVGALLRLRASLFDRLRWRRHSARANPGTRAWRSGRSRTAILETRAGRMSRLAWSRPHWPLSRPFKRTAWLPTRRSGRKTMVAPRLIQSDLLHRFP